MSNDQSNSLLTKIFKSSTLNKHFSCAKKKVAIVGIQQRRVSDFCHSCISLVVLEAERLFSLVVCSKGVENCQLIFGAETLF